MAGYGFPEHVREPSFPVSFAMEFTETLYIYEIVGSARFATAECINIPLLRMQCHGTPVRKNEYSDWWFLSYQELDGYRPFYRWMPWLHFEVKPTAAFVMFVF